MSLQVWLPLNGDLHNQGCTDLEFTNSNATINTSGKIGSCYSFNGSNAQIYAVHDKSIWNDKPISICMWYKFVAGNITNCVVDIAADLCLSYVQNSSGLRFSYWRAYPNSSGTRTGDSNTISKYYDVNSWHHVVYVADHNLNEIYVDGVLASSFDSAAKYTANFKPLLGSGYNRITVGKSAGSSPFASGLVNDVRIYDHALSAAEVHEIAQGLVLHYKLDTLYPASPTHIDSTINDTAYNSSISKYGYNTTSNLAKTSGIFQGKQCIKVSTITAGQNAQPYAYFSNLFTSNGTNQPAYKRLEFDYYTTCPTTTWLNIYKLGSGTGTASWTTQSSAGTRSGMYTNSESGHNLLVVPNEWNHVSVVFHGDTDANAEWGYCINGPTHVSNTNYYFLYANIEVTASSDLAAEDSSGYNHHGTSFGSLISTAETGRYSSSTKLNSSSPTDSTETGITYILSPLALTTPNQMTVAWWAKPESGYGGGTGNAAFCTSVNSRPTDYNATAMHHRDARFDLCPNSGSSIQLTFNQYTANQWHHYAITYDGQKATAYKDGVALTNTSMAAAGPLKSFNNIWIGYSQAGGVKRKTLGSYSDFRVYVTALSADDVLTLYHTGAKIDNKGNTHAYEFVEHQENILFPVELSRTKLEFTNGLSRYTQANCQVNLVEDGYHIYRPPNLTQSANGNTMWGGLQLVNQSVNTVAAYNATRDNWWHLQQNHTYIAAFHARGKSSNATTWSWTNNMGWGGGGVQPAPTTIVNEGIPADFNGEKDCFYIFKITDAISKPCTTAYSAYAAGTTYLSYRHLTFGWGYTSTGTLGTDLYLTNFRLYDITSNMAQFTKQGQANFYDIIEQMNKAQIRKNSELLSSEFIEL